MRFAVLAPNPQQTILVSETRQIFLNHGEVENTTLQAQRQAGTWASSQPVTLPANAQSGSYRIVMTVKAEGTEATHQPALR